MSKHQGNEFNRTVQVGQYAFRFVEGSANDYFYALKDGLNPGLIMFIHVTDAEGTIVAEYERLWENRFNSSHIYAFMDKFLRDSEYRKRFQTSGEPISVEKPKPDKLVNPQCEKAIQKINNSAPGKLKFRDFAALKTYGRDKVSSMKMDALKDVVSGEELEKIQGSVCEEDVITTLRWIKRGLNVDHAIHKVKVDREITNNAKGWV